LVTLTVKVVMNNIISGIINQTRTLPVRKANLFSLESANNLTTSKTKEAITAMTVIDLSSNYSEIY
jgi:hypothetical protein